FTRLCGFSAGSPADSRPQLARAPRRTARCSRHLWAGVVWCEVLSKGVDRDVDAATAALDGGACRRTNRSTMSSQELATEPCSACRRHILGRIERAVLGRLPALRRRQLCELRADLLRRTARIGVDR